MRRSYLCLEILLVYRDASYENLINENEIYFSNSTQKRKKSNPTGSTKLLALWHLRLGHMSRRVEFQKIFL